MASIDDCFNQLVAANGELSQIDQGIQTVNTSIQAVDADVQATTAAVQSRIQPALHDRELHQPVAAVPDSADDTMVCYLEKITRQTCALLNDAALQTTAQQAMRADLDDLKQLYELANPAAAVEQGRLEDLKAQVEKCCPPSVPTPPCKFEPCKRPGDVPPPPRP